MNILNFEGLVLQKFHELRLDFLKNFTQDHEFYVDGSELSIPVITLTARDHSNYDEDFELAKLIVQYFTEFQQAIEAKQIVLSTDWQKECYKVLTFASPYVQDCIDLFENQFFYHLEELWEDLGGCEIEHHFAEFLTSLVTTNPLFENVEIEVSTDADNQNFIFKAIWEEWQHFPFIRVESQPCKKMDNFEQISVEYLTESTLRNRVSHLSEEKYIQFLTNFYQLGYISEIRKDAQGKEFLISFDARSFLIL